MHFSVKVGNRFIKVIGRTEDENACYQSFFGHLQPQNDVTKTQAC